VLILDFYAGTGFWGGAQKNAAIVKQGKKDWGKGADCPWYARHDVQHIGFTKEYESGRKESSFHPFLQELAFIQRRQKNLAVAQPTDAPVATPA